jgi:hypothetical protein
MPLTVQDFHDLLHKDVGTPADSYKLVRRGKSTIRKPIKKEHSAHWAEATVSLGANKVLLNVYLDLQQNDLSNADYQRLKQLALNGVGQYWSRDIKLGTEIFTVNTIANHRKNDSIDADLSIETSADYGRSFNVGIFGIDASFKYNQGAFRSKTNADLNFKLVCAHEFGHSVLQYFGGESLSWSHKGSTKIIPQSAKSSTPGYPNSGEIDLMKYYDRNKASARFSRIISDTKASEQDVKRLIWSSVVTF